MQREVTGWYSPSLNKQMDIAVYGHYGIALLLIPTASSDYLEYEQNGLIESIAPYINSGKVKVYCINSINGESWLNPYMHGYDKAVRHQHFNDYVIKEVIPFIKENSSPKNEIITAGASLGAFHAANLFFRYPDFINGVIGMSGCYDLSVYTNGYYDDNVYFNSPIQYLSQLKAEWQLSLYRESRHIHFVTGSGAFEVPEYSKQISAILSSKNVPHELDIWGEDIPHEWWAWKRMLPYYLETRF
ncbi:esterase family protein [Dyadobacter subterraneus]|uniref:Esterase family protein n=1 Tax=Dyadobacter subterraneus TaxID=2773304 RepID=A0ABR9W5P3_9BACT|nr:alpha/beta hydrolase-fold protein [Dyadobacter subterraneus]MBE9460766.1 esterase family protein [Dyadobacter subterraneus]